MLAIAKQLNRTLILTGIKKHYMDRGRQLSTHSMLRLQAQQAWLKATNSAASPTSGSSPTTASQPGKELPRPCFAEAAAPDWMAFEELMDR